MNHLNYFTRLAMVPVVYATGSLNRAFLLVFALLVVVLCEMAMRLSSL